MKRNPSHRATPGSTPERQKPEAMEIAGLTSFWIKPPDPRAPLGFGVTGRSRTEALAIIRAMGYGRYLPDDLAGVQITEGITVGELDERHVVANMGPIAVRGMWYPFVEVGLAAWAGEQLRSPG